MSRRVPAFLVALVLSAFAYAAPITGSHTFEVGESEFLLDGKPFLLRVGDIHPSRVPRAYWRHRLRMLKACGFNAVGSHVFWNYHETAPGVYDFTGDKDLVAFYRIAQEEGLWVLVKMGPYACSEWEFGGLPWWLLKEKDIRLRSCDGRFLKPASDWLKTLGKTIADCQVTRGGNVLMVQVGNEYGFWGNDSEYMRKLLEAIRSSGIDVPAFCCNPPEGLMAGDVAGIIHGVNVGGDPEKAIAKMRAECPGQPLFCTESYPSWYDIWGEKRRRKSFDRVLKDLDCMLSQRMSVSMWMGHGGTSFGWWAGSNVPFRPIASSYDFGAPISEPGWAAPGKFEETRKLFAQYLNPGETIPEPPARLPTQSADFPFTLCSSMHCIPDHASIRKARLPSVASEHPLTFEQADLGYGVAVYRTTIPAGLGGELRTDIRDLGIVFVDGEYLDFFDRRDRRIVRNLPASDKPRALEIVVEPMGRLNFGHAMHLAQKGIVGDVKLGGKALLGWVMDKFDFASDDVDGLSFSHGPLDPDTSNHRYAGSFFKFQVPLKAGADTFLDMRDWGRGAVRVNGHWIGRYWSIGPTQTMYIPGCWLKDGRNEIIVWDVLGEVKDFGVLKFLDEPIYEEMHPEKDYLVMTDRAKLVRMPTCEPAHIGSFENSLLRQDIRFAKPAKGRYFILEGLSSLDGHFAAGGSEIDLVDAVGKNIPHSEWTIKAGDSEEVKGNECSLENLIDGQTDNLWHTQYVGAKPDYPHYFVIDLGKEETVGGFNFTPRQDKGNGRIKDFRIYVTDSVEVR